MQSTEKNVPEGTLVAKVSVLSPQQAQFLQPISPELINEHVNVLTNLMQPQATLRILNL